MDPIDIAIVVVLSAFTSFIVTTICLRPINETLSAQQEFNRTTVEAIQSLGKYDEAMNELLFQNDGIDGWICTPNFKKESD